VLDAVEAFFFGGGNQAAISHKCRAGVAVVRIYPDDSIHDCDY